MAWIYGWYVKYYVQKMQEKYTKSQQIQEILKHSKPGMTTGTGLTGLQPFVGLINGRAVWWALREAPCLHLTDVFETAPVGFHGNWRNVVQREIEISRRKIRRFLQSAKLLGEKMGAPWIFCCDHGPLDHLVEFYATYDFSA